MSHAGIYKPDMRMQQNQASFAGGVGGTETAILAQNKDTLSHAMRSNYIVDAKPVVGAICT